MWGGRSTKWFDVILFTNIKKTEGLKELLLYDATGVQIKI